MALGLVVERRGARVEGAVYAHEIDVIGTELGHAVAERSRVRRLHRAEAPVAPAVVGGAQGAAARVGDRTEAGRAVGDHDADGPAALALDADAVCANARAPAVEVGVDDLEQ